MEINARRIAWVLGLVACTHLSSPDADHGLDPGPDIRDEDHGATLDVAPDLERDPGGDSFADSGQDLSLDSGPSDLGPVTDPGADPSQDSGLPLTGAVEVSPYTIEFAYVAAGGEARRPILVKNLGPGALEVRRLRFTGSLDFAPDLEIEARPGPSGERDYNPSPAQVLAPGETWRVPIVFRPTVEGDANGEVQVFTSDPNRSEPARAFLRGNLSRPCIRLRPDQVDFGAVTPEAPGRAQVRVESCGQMDLRIDSVTLSPDARDAGVSMGFTEFGSGLAPTPAAPVVLPPGASAALDLSFDPVNPPAEGAALTGRVAFQGNQFFGVTMLPLAGTAYADFCAQPVIRPLSDSVIPIGSVIRADGRDSWSPFGAVNSWRWSLDQPGENQGVVTPSEGAIEVGAFAAAVGTYRLHLEVGDDQGYPSCGKATFQVQASPDQIATVSLTWVRRDGGAPIAGIGPDLDLHFLYPAAGTDDCAWYHRDYDCNPYNNPEPEPATWGGQKVSLVSQSPDGQLPEAVRMELPSCPEGRKFRFGVHYRSGTTAGPVDATLAVHFYGRWAWSRTVRLRGGDLWDAGVITCGSGTGLPEVTETAGPRILSSFTPCP